jgi:hypothetical protein
MGVSVTIERWDTLHELAVTNKGHEKKKHGISLISQEEWTNNDE